MGASGGDGGDVGVFSGVGSIRLVGVAVLACWRVGVDVLVGGGVVCTLRVGLTVKVGVAVRVEIETAVLVT